MEKKFMMSFPDGMPKGTAQQKRYDGRRGIYFKDKKLLNLEMAYAMALLPHKIREPITEPVKLTLWFGFDVKERSKWGTYKTSRPDLDNYSKALIDVMVKSGFFTDDSLIADLHLIKTYAETAFIWAEIETLEKKFGGIT